MYNLKQAAESVLSNGEFDFQIQGEPTHIKVEAYDGDIYVGRFALAVIPSNPHYVLSWGVEIDEDWRGIGLGQEFLEKRIQIVRETKAHTYVNVVNWENDVQKHIMRKYGFEPIGEEEDGRNTSMWSRQINQAVPA